MTKRPTFGREKALISLGYLRVAGVDEAGRGPLAGPVVAAAVVMPCRFRSKNFKKLNDSKQLCEELRELLYAELTHSVEWGVAAVEPAEIDRINIRQASWLAMQLAVADLTAKHESARLPDYVLIDGLPYGPGPWPYEAIIKGDGRCLSIAAASVIAKVTRDRIMRCLHDDFPHYGFAQHKGYGTREHLQALQTHGPCDHHRRSYAPVRQATGEEIQGDLLSFIDCMDVVGEA